MSEHKLIKFVDCVKLLQQYAKKNDTLLHHDVTYNQNNTWYCSLTYKDIQVSGTFRSFEIGQHELSHQICAKLHLGVPTQTYQSFIEKYYGKNKLIYDHSYRSAYGWTCQISITTGGTTSNYNRTKWLSCEKAAYELCQKLMMFPTVNTR